MARRRLSVEGRDREIWLSKPRLQQVLDEQTASGLSESACPSFISFGKAISGCCYSELQGCRCAQQPQHRRTFESQVKG